MSLYQIAKILEISGFALASIFGGIFLSREVSGSFAYKLDKEVTSISKRLNAWLTKWLSPLVKYFELTEKYEVTRQVRTGISVRGFSVVILVIGLALDISWLFWLGLVLSSVYVLLTVGGVFMRTLYLSYKRKSLWYMFSYPLFLSWGLLVAFVIAPIILLMYLIAVYSLLAAVPLASVLTISDNLKRGLIIAGSTLAVTGLVLETIATW